jgi:uroporphyrin-III C-methyltransferase/precorrin-2 dehydrogenase/sirohydrochlorin ferrochelatase
MFVKLEGRRCLLVGAGRVAEQKIESLLLASAAVEVVAPEASEVIRRLAAGGRVRWIAREFLPADLDGACLVIAATGDEAVNREIFREAERRGILCNAVDEPDSCHFYYSSVVRRGDLQIAISTAGHSPALAQRLRRELEERYGPEYGPWLRWLGTLRRKYFQRAMDPQQRKHALHQIASREAFERFTVSLLPGGEQGSSGGRRNSGKVFLVGAGPGDPELLTVRAVRLLQRADVVLHDDLISVPILELIHPGARIINVGKRCRKKFLTQEEINALMIFHAGAAETVIRLKGGDPSVFGRAGEEIEALNEAGISFEIVPGITSALAGAAAAGISLTDRRLASSVVFATGHRRPGAAAEWEQLIASGSTLAIYMPGAGYAELASELRAAGMDESMPCVAVSSAGRPDQQVLWTTLSCLGRSAALPAPSLLIVGECARALSTPPAVRGKPEPAGPRPLAGALGPLRGEDACEVAG